MAATCCLNDRWYVHANKPLIGYDLPNLRAYSVDDVGQLGAGYFALVCDPKLTARTDVLSVASKIGGSNVMLPIDFGVAAWAPLNRRVRILIFQDPEATRFLKPGESDLAPWSEQEILVGLVAPLLETLLKFEQAGITHRGIRADNLFMRGARTQRKILLGDCTANPPAFDQPPAYQTIEDTFADPPARGASTSAEDLYALGVLILHLLTGKMPGDDLTTDQLVAGKLENGSYTTLVGTRRAPVELIDLVRGLLVDRREERWTIVDIAQWLDRGRLMKVPPRRTKVGIPIDVSGQRFFGLRTFVVWLLHGDEKLVAKALRNADVDSWVVTQSGDEKVIERYRNTISSSDPSPGQLASMLARLGIILDPASPIRYRTLAVRQDGIGDGLAAYLQKGVAEEIKAFGELLVSRLPQHWLANQKNLPQALVQRVFVFDKVCRYLADTRPGNGIERAAYELSPSLHCLSPVVEAAFAESPLALVEALEAAVVAGKIEGWPVDRHVLAFFAARMSDSNMDAEIINLNSGEHGVRWCATVRLFSAVQEKFGPAALPALTRLFAGMATPAIERYRNRNTRKTIKAAMADLTKTGRLKPLLELIDDEDAIQRDNARFDRAYGSYAVAEKKLADCEHALANLRSRSQQIGNTVCVTVASVLSVMIAIVSLIAMGVV